MVDASMAKDGELAKKLRYITVFQNETAGKDPKNAGLGLDDQEPPEVDGMTIPAVGMVQILMPKNPTPEQWVGIHGARALWGHEIVGHENEINNQVRRNVREVDPDRHIYVSANSWVDVIPADVVAQ